MILLIPFGIELNSMTNIVMYAIPTKWLELGYWLQLLTLFPSPSFIKISWKLAEISQLQGKPTSG